jgi:hypothetical protein
MVPEGTYRVLASKDGYADYNSQPQFGYLLVPPPRSDVNFSMIPAGDPRVISIEISEKGTLIADKFTAKPGELVSVTGIPDDAYMLAGISVVDSNGKSVRVIKNDESYEFVMPSSDVKVSGLYSAKASASVVVEIQEGEITASALNLNEAAVLVVAQYDEKGRMISVVFGTEKQDRLTVSVVNDCVEAKAFLLDGISSMRPISGEATCSVKKK